MKENKTIEQLFRKEFESFEVQPSKKVWRAVRSDLFIKKFLHFSPKTFNIWYAVGIIMVSSAVLFSLTKPKEKFSQKEIADIPVKTLANPDSLVSSLQSSGKPTYITKPLDASPVRDQGPDCNKTLTEIPGTKNPGTVLSPVSEKPVNLDKMNIVNYNGQSVIAWFECLTPEGCVPLKSVFRNFSQNAVHYSWSFGDGSSSELANPSHIFDEPGTWFVSLTAYSSNNEISIFTDSIQVKPLPVARFSMDIQGLPGDGQPVYFYNYSSGAEKYYWDFGDGTNSCLKEPDHYFTKKTQTNIKLLAISAAGCNDSIILKNAFKEGEPAFIFPTAFSPNTNGPGTGQYTRMNPANDVFHPYTEEEPEEYQLRIFNRNGIQIFESTDILVGWDGYYRQELQPQGVYVWKAKAKFADGRNVEKMGDVTLLWGE